jgi:hypothetical protein
VATKKKDVLFRWRWAWEDLSEHMPAQVAHPFGSVYLSARFWRNGRRAKSCESLTVAGGSFLLVSRCLTHGDLSTLIVVE